MPNLTTFGQLPAVHLQAPDGAEAIITVFGAQVMSWRPAGGEEQLFCGEKSVLDGSKTIRGGIPVVFPQFSERGDVVRHGFARISQWQVVQNGVANGVAFAEFLLDSAGSYADRWPHPFQLTLRVAIHANQLQINMRVRNTGPHPFAFAAALHSYFRVEEVTKVCVAGLQNSVFSDHRVQPEITGNQSAVLLRTEQALDRVYAQIPDELVLINGKSQLTLQQEGFSQAVIWNPGAVALEDLEADDYHHFLCIEPALFDPFWLKADEEWHGQHSLTATF